MRILIFKTLDEQNEIYEYLKKQDEFIIELVNIISDNIDSQNNNFFIAEKSLLNLKKRQLFIKNITDKFGYPLVIIVTDIRFLWYIKSMFIFSSIILILPKKTELEIKKMEEKIINLIDDIYILSNEDSYSNVIDYKTKSSNELVKVLRKAHKKILLCTTQYPGYGGAASNTYYIYQFLKEMDYNICIIFFENSFPSDLNIIDENVILSKRSITKENVNKINKILGGEPDEIYCKNWLAPNIISTHYGFKKTIYLVSGSIQASQFSNHNIFAQDILMMNKSKFKKLESQINIYNIKAIIVENETLKRAKFIVFNSDLTSNIFDKLYNYDINKVFVSDTSNIYLRNLLQNQRYITMEKKYDIGFISSELSRTVKNFDLFKKICLHDQIKNYPKVIIGKKQKNELEDIIKYEHFECLTNKKVEEILSMTRILIIPSFYDSSPNILREALQNDCKVLTSPNIGSSLYLDKKYICNDYTNIEAWIEKIKNVLC